MGNDDVFALNALNMKWLGMASRAEKILEGIAWVDFVMIGARMINEVKPVRTFSYGLVSMRMWTI